MRVVFLIFSFLIAAIPFGLIFSLWFKGIDVRKIGSGNIGATNVLRAAGWKIALLTAIFDISKAAIPVYLAGKWFSIEWAYLTGIITVLGHTFSPYLKFKGGKGVACFFGVLLGLNPLWFFISLVMFVILIKLTSYVSVSSMTIALLSSFYPLIFEKDIRHVEYLLLIAVIIIIRHHSNISRLIAGKEPKFGRKKA